MYTDSSIRKAHYKDLLKVLEDSKKDPSATEYRINTIKRCIEACKDEEEVDF
tara:strand:- start:561 stop:716 length:156 start_codon:yes stop_codon:yes gene_type:complete